MIKEIQCMGQAQNHYLIHKTRTQYSPFEIHGNKRADEIISFAVLSLFYDGGLLRTHAILITKYCEIEKVCKH